MAVAFRAAEGGNIGGATAITVNVPAGTALNDVMVAVVIVGAASRLPNTPAGWTALDNQSSGPSVQTYWRLATGSEPANYTWTWTGSAAASAVIASYSGCDTTTPIGVHGAFHRTATTTTLTADSVTTTVDGSMLVFAGVIGQVVTFTGPTSFTQRATPTGIGVAALLADLPQATHGATGTVTATGSASGNTDGSLIALAPASSGTTFTQTLSASSTASASRLFGVGRGMTSTSTTTGSAARATSKPLSAASTGTAGLTRAIGRVLSATTAGGAVLAATKVALLVLSAAATTTAQVVKQAGKALRATASAVARLLLPSSGTTPPVDLPTSLVLAEHPRTLEVEARATSMTLASHPTTMVVADHPNTLSLDG